MKTLTLLLTIFTASANAQKTTVALDRQKSLSSQVVLKSENMDIQAHSNKLTTKNLNEVFRDNSAKAIEAKTPQKLSKMSLGGSEGTGGGPTINGKIIEKYRVDITQTPEYKVHVNPILNQLKTIYSEFPQKLERVATKKTWYMIPVSIKVLPPKIVGLGHLDMRNVDYKYPSIQTIFSVWTDQNRYNQLGDLRSKAEHLFHELALGLYEDEFESNLAEAEEKARSVAAALMNVTSSTTAEQFESSLDAGKLEISLAKNYKTDYPAKLDAQQVAMMVYNKKLSHPKSCYTATLNQAQDTVVIACDGQEIMVVKEVRFGGEGDPQGDSRYGQNFGAMYQADIELHGDPNQAGAVKKIAWFTTDRLNSLSDIAVTTYISIIGYNVAEKKRYIEWLNKGTVWFHDNDGSK